jgi:hypothetical protein
MSHELNKSLDTSESSSISESTPISDSSPTALRASPKTLDPNDSESAKIDKDQEDSRGSDWGSDFFDSVDWDDENHPIEPEPV